MLPRIKQFVLGFFSSFYIQHQLFLFYCHLNGKDLGFYKHLLVILEKKNSLGKI